MTKPGADDRRAPDRVAKQCLKFDMALRRGAVSARCDGDIKAQSLHYAGAVAALREKELQAREVLMWHGLFRTEFMPYFRFVRTLSKAAKLYWADDFHLAAEAAAARWAGQGCDPVILREILFNVFNVGLDGKPETRSTHCQTGTAEVNDKSSPNGGTE
jgi:hypothetical protein